MFLFSNRMFTIDLMGFEVIFNEIEKRIVKKGMDIL
jgi:hypothetical protein